MSNLSISCIIPVYNGERFIEEAIGSILAQTCQPDEIIVIDDGSTDDTGGKVSRYNHRLTYVYQPNAGPAAARNRGLELAHGDYIAFLDADDLWHPEKLEQQLERFECRPETDISITHVQNFIKNPQTGERLPHCEKGRPLNLPGYITQTLLARTEVFRRVGIFDTSFRLSDATEWFLRAEQSNVVVDLISDVLVYRRLHEHNISQANLSVSHDEHLKLIKQSLHQRRGSNNDVRLLNLPK